MYATLVYNPLYNGFVFLMGALPFLDAGIIVVLFTVIVKLILFPISKKAVRTQAMMKLIEPEMNALKEKYKGDRQAQSLAIMKFYKEKQINPFSSIFLLLIQLPIIFALYYIFLGGFSSIDTSILYSFVHPAVSVNHMFLGFMDVTQKSLILAILAAVSQYFQIQLSTPPAPTTPPNGSFQDTFARSMHVQMKYIFPIMILFIGYNVAGALALYWTTSNLFMIGQELVIRRQMKAQKKTA